MGDMKTPDFDDLLAAFDIPDATGLDAKEPIQGSQDETESQLKHTGMCLDDGLLSNQAVAPADIPAVSVIVKNTSRQDSLEVLGGTFQNGFRGQDTALCTDGTSNADFSNSFVSALNGESSRELLGKAPVQQKPEGTPVFSRARLNPISSPGPEDAFSREKIHPKESPCFPDASVLREPSIPDNPQALELSVFDDRTKESDISLNTHKTKTEGPTSEEEVRDGLVCKEPDKNTAIQAELLPSSGKLNCVEANSDTGSSVDVPASNPFLKSQTSKLSSCLEALAVLNARKDLREASVHTDGVKASPNVPISPRSPRSPLEAVKRFMKPSDSPASICSDSSGKASPALTSGSPPAIPRVRIKTIKTTTGQIKRTVTSVLPDSETDELHSAYESSPSQSMISEDSYCNTSPRHSQAAAVVGAVEIQTEDTRVKNPKVLHSRSKAAARRSGAVLSTAGLGNGGASAKRSGPLQGQRPKRRANSASANHLPKAVHLASLNLVPHSVAASVAARSASHQPSQHAVSSAVYSSVPLVHQVKTAKARPYASAANSAAGTLNRLLNNANPVPTYVPDLSPPPGCNISLPARGYCCLECGDSFCVERSLARHYGRRSVHIEVGCAHCAKTVVFFNRCALLAHAREHKSGGAVMQCTQLHVKPIAAEQMFAPDYHLAAAASSAPHSRRSQPVLPLYPDYVVHQRLRCQECSAKLADYKALAGHYQRLAEDVEGLMCDLCSMLLPNKCSFRAHERIHTHKSPYCCPECGAPCRSSDLQKHVKENCLHYARKAWYKCLHCDMVFKTLQGQKSHIEEKHCEVFYKCSVCPVAFKTAEGCQVHLLNKHGASETPPLLIFKCSCETVFKKKQLLLEHFHQNANKRVTSVFKCPECNSVFPQKHLLMHHFKGVHAGSMMAEGESGGFGTNSADRHKNSHSVSQKKRLSPLKHGSGGGPRKKAEQESRTRVKPTGWTCGECLQWFPERDAYVSHVKTTHRKLVKKYPCRHCDQSFNSTTSLRRHNRTNHSGNKKLYTCWYCTDSKTTFTSSVMLKNHISLMHGIKNPDLGQMPKTSNQDSKTTPRKELALDRAAPDAQRREEDGVLNLGAPSTKRPKAQFRCSKCGFVTDDGGQFQRHIPQHKTDGDTPQCLRCGLCFTSALSLNRHLFIVHQVKEGERAAGGGGGGGGGEEEEEREGEGEELEKMEQDNQPARAAADGNEADEADEADDARPPRLSEPEVPQTEEPTGPQRDEAADGDWQQQQKQQSPRSHTEAAALR